MDISNKVMYAFAVWIVVCLTIVYATRTRSNLFSSFARRMFCAGAGLLTATIALNSYTGFIYLEYFRFLSSDVRGPLEEIALLSTQNLISFTTIFSGMFGASLGGNLLYKAAYPRN